MKAIIFKNQVIPIISLHINNIKIAIIMVKIINIIIQVNAVVHHNKTLKFIIKNTRQIKVKDRKMEAIESSRDNLMELT